MKQKPQTNELSKGMPGPIPAWQTEKNCAEADNAYGKTTSGVMKQPLMKMLKTL